MPQYINLQTNSQSSCLSDIHLVYHNKTADLNPYQMTQQSHPPSILNTTFLWSQWCGAYTGFHGDSFRWCLILPIGSMYGIYANNWGILMVNVTIYGIHGSYGLGGCGISNHRSIITLPSDIPQPGCRMHPSWSARLPGVVEATKQYETLWNCPVIKHGYSWKIPLPCI